MFERSNLGVYEPIPLEINDYKGIREILQKDGVCVIKNILNDNEKELFLNYFWDSIERRQIKINRNNTSTWIPENTEWHGNYGAGQYKHYGMGQEKHCWLIRKNQIIRNIFEKGVYGNDEDDNYVEKCCVSLDGCAALFNPCESQLKLHVDLVPDLDGFDFGSVQGAYNLYPVTIDEQRKKATSGFVCVVGSHKLYDQLWSDRKKVSGYKHPKKHWHVLEPDSPLQSQASFILSPENSLVLWRSDLLHKNYGGDFTSEELTPPGSPPRLCRLTQFISFQPTKYRTNTVLSSKIKCVVEGASMSHWAALAFRVPVIAFPSWTNKAKEIPVIIPTFTIENEQNSNDHEIEIERDIINEEVKEEVDDNDEEKEEEENGEENDEDENVNDKRKKTKNNTKKVVKRQRKADLSKLLPEDILNLL